MAAYIFHSFVCSIVVLAIALQIPTSSGQLTSDYYDEICPDALPTVRAIVEEAILNEARMGASLLRLHFHDCFVNGCDGSVLLVDTANFTGEQSANPNLNSLRGFDVVAEIKTALNNVCGGCKVSCADILAIAARDSVNILGGPWYEVLLGRNDSLTASEEAANEDLPSPSSNFTALIGNFVSHGLNLTDLVLLSGGHTIGLARCVTFRSRIYNDTDIDPAFAAELETVVPCANDTSIDGNNTWPLDNTTTQFDSQYYMMLTQQQGLLHSDQELFNGGNTTSADLVTYYSNNQDAFWADFTDSMIKMGNLPAAIPTTQVRCNCSIPNDPALAPAPQPSSSNSEIPSDNPFPTIVLPKLPINLPNIRSN